MYNDVTHWNWACSIAIRVYKNIQNTDTNLGQVKEKRSYKQQHQDNNNNNRNGTELPKRSKIYKNVLNENAMEIKVSQASFHQVQNKL